ncbi:hypothetical protein [Nonomuraea jabiensis]|uniref:hypothetical protein n=1 Tax=Nonomuraea jabiensis TaxID=882448 RepID=UPI00369DF41A
MTCTDGIIGRRTARGPLVLPWNANRLVDVARPERLARHCTSCGFHWDEAPLDAPPTVPAVDAHEGQADEEGSTHVSHQRCVATE